ncbi:hypothetical protein BCR42DRAFT_409247 [Absidia repens]|uniref:SEC7 domain-containing protein n=1 Tax=Absidia repens TaxID=90262 RepID=A0A1X2IQZ2_9FUNG|nr:hypothetical protein BCR42DRAFT_409247 [Absidia repens]
MDITIPSDSSSPISSLNAIQLKSELTWTQLVHAEIIAVTSAMRKNARWSGTKVSGFHMGGLGTRMGLRKGISQEKNRDLDIEENPLMTGFTNLKAYLETLQDVKDLDALVLLNPFLQVIRSGTTTGPIAGAALGSVEKFLHYGIVGLYSPSISFAMNALLSAATHCQFEASDATSDELVLLRMLQLLHIAVTGECGQVLSDDTVCEMMGSCLTMCCQMRLSELLRRSTEHVMTKMVVSIFERLKIQQDEWQLVESPAESDTDNGLSKNAQTPPASQHVNMPRSSSSPSPLPSSPTISMPVAELRSKDVDTAEHGQHKHIENVAQDTAPVTAVDGFGNPTSPTTSSVPHDNVEHSSAEDHQEPLDNLPLQPYGLVTIRELLMALVSLINPHDHTHTDSMRMMALGLLNVALEVGGRSVSQLETLRNLVTDEACKFLFQLAKTDSPHLLSSTLRTITTVFDTFQPYIKLQQELFLFFLIERLSPPTGMGSRPYLVDVDDEGNISFVSSQHGSLDEVTGGGGGGGGGGTVKASSPATSASSSIVGGGGGGGIHSAADSRTSSPNLFLGRSTDYHQPKPYRTGHAADQRMIPGEIREVLLECLVQCARMPTFMVDLWFNYDCDVSCGDLFEDLIQFLSKNSFPDSYNYSTTTYHDLCLDTLLTFIDHMVDRSVDEVGSSEDKSYMELTPATELSDRKAKKIIVLAGSKLFNENPKKGVAYLKEKGIVMADANDDAKESLALFLRSTQQLNKKTLGEYLGKPDNLELLQVFMKQFNFEGKRMDEALRMVLETFRLPGESQQIMRVADTFSKVYFDTGPTEIANVEAAEVLAYSIILLNTDQHNPQIRVRMTFDGYMRNLRGVNDKENFSEDYLHDIYEAIRQDEIVMPEEHEGRFGFNYAWKQLLHQSINAGPFVVCNTSRYDKAMFEMSWKPAIAAITYAFNTAQDDTTLQKAISGFHQCAMLSAFFELYEVFDSIVVNLATMTGLLDTYGSSASLPDPIAEVAGEKYVISSFAIQFGKDYKAQLAAVVVFTIVTRHGNSLRNGWTKILQVIRNLFLNALLPQSMLQVEDFLSGTTSIPLKPKTPAPSRQPQQQQQRTDGSLLSTLSSYLLSPYPHDETYRTKPTDEEVESTLCALDCIGACRLEELFSDISNLEMDSLRALMTAIQQVGYDHDIDKNDQTLIPYDPATVLFLEFMVTISTRNKNRIDLLWPYAMKYIFDILKHAENQSVLVVERTVVGLLRLCISIADQEKMQDDILKCLQLLRDFPTSVIKAVAEQLMAGIYNLSSANSENLNNAEFLATILEIKQKVASSL